MIASRMATAVCLAAVLCAAQTYNIRGTVTDSADAGISGATVKLEKAGIAATTGADGVFALGGVTGMGPVGANGSLAASCIRVGNGGIAFTLSGNAPVAIGIHDIGGRQLYSVEAAYSSGAHEVRAPFSCAGILLYRVAIGGEAFLFKALPPGISAAAHADGGGASALARQARPSAMIADVIAVVGEGYLNHRDSIKTSDTSGIVIRMLPNAGNVTDADGNVYQSVRIGNQVWTAENLRTTKYNDGTSIPIVTGKAEWMYLTTPGYCFYDNSTALADQRKWGALYNWYAVNTGTLAPAGWHVPTDEEWTILENHLINNGYGGDGTTAGNKIAKSLAAKTDWYPSRYEGTPGNDMGRNNAGGFSALPGGYRVILGGYENRNYHGMWWSATDSNAHFAFNRGFSCYTGELTRTGTYKPGGFSVRLLRD